MPKLIKIPILKVKRGDKIGTLFHGIKIVDYLVHYSKSKCVQLTYMDGSIIWCTDHEEVEVMQSTKAIRFYFHSTDLVDYDNPIRLDYNKIKNNISCHKRVK